MTETSKRSFYIEEIKRLNDLFQNECILSKLNQFEADEYIKLLDSNFLGVRLQQSDLVCDKNSSEAILSQAKIEYAETEKIYISLKAKLRNISENPVAQMSSASSVNQKGPKLEITWEKFSGNYKDWLVFYVNFSEAVNNNSRLNEAKKYEILVESTQGKAQAMVKEGKSFVKAWSMLKLFYGNAFRQAHATLGKLWKIEPIKKRSAEAFSMLIEQLDGYVSTLKRAHDNDDITDIIPLIVVDKMDETTKNLWYNHYAQDAVKWAGLQTARSEGATAKTVEASDYIPNWPNTRAFLLSQMQDLKQPGNMRFRSESQMQPADMRARSSSQMRSVEANCRENLQMREVYNEVGTKRKEYCTKCGAFHRLYKCENYRAMSLPRRWSHVIQNNLCVKCLHPKHSSPCLDPDNNKKCEACKPDVAFHNSTLCRNIVKDFE